MKRWPVCFCADCIRCGCNVPWNHHNRPQECTLMQKKRFPRKAKKWAKRSGVDLISVSGKRMWYARTLGNARNAVSGLDI